MHSRRPWTSSEMGPAIRRHQGADAPTLRFHRVEAGETLTAIARKLYGHDSFWVLLYGANEKLMREERGLRPGQILYAPFL